MKQYHPKMKQKRNEIVFTTFFLLGAMLIFATSFHYFQKMITGIVENKIVKEEIWYNVILRIHIVCGLIAIFSGPFQLSKTFREKKLYTHKKLGYVYTICVLISGTTGLIIAQYAIGGIISTIGFSCLSLLWIISMVLSIKAIRNKKILEHRKWMFINYALTFSSIPQRFLLALAFIPSLSFVNVYRMSAWVSWMINILIALYCLKRVSNKGDSFRN